jgi:hypothetical protein
MAVISGTPCQQMASRQDTPVLLVPILDGFLLAWLFQPGKAICPLRSAKYVFELQSSSALEPGSFSKTSNLFLGFTNLSAASIASAMASCRLK